MDLFNIGNETESALDAFLADPNLRELWFENTDKDALMELIRKKEASDKEPVADNNSLNSGKLEDDIDEEDLLVKLSISRDEMSAWVKLSPLLKDKNYDFIEEMIFEVLNQHNIVFGIQKQQIKRFVNNPVYDKNILVAQGRKPIEGKDGAIKFSLDMKSNLTPREPNVYTVDPEKPDFINYVKAGTLLCTSSNTKNDFTGCNIRGRVVQPIYGGLDQVIAGKNVQKSSDERRWYATEDGELILENGIISIVPVLRVENVDNSSGDIEFDGSVYVLGNVEFGKVIKASNNVIVGGIIQDANIVAGGHLAVGKGITGSKSSSIQVIGSLRTPFAEYVNMKVGGDIFADVLMGGDITCDGGVFVLGNRGLIVSCKCSAREITSNEIGNYTGSKTIVEIMSLGLIEDEMEEKSNEIKNWTERKKKMDILMREANKARQQVLTHVREQIEQELYEAHCALDNFQRRVDLIRRKYSFEVRVKNTVYPKVTFVFNNKSIVNERSLMHCRVSYRYGQLHVDTFRSVNIL